jgi:ABC-type multidrug transport system ATPase subunit
VIKFSAKNIKKSFSSNDLIKDISLELSSGDRLLITGANGIGKSTLFKIFSGHLHCDSGEIFINDHSFSSLSFYEIKTHIALISSNENHLYPRLNGLENIEYFGKVLGLDLESIEKRISTWSELKIFNEALKTSYHLCSQGMKKVLELFILTMHSPKVLILDECFKSFDSSNREDILKLIDREFKEGILILCSHHESELSSIIEMSKFKLDGGLHAY